MRGGDLRADARGAVWNDRIKEADHVNAFLQRRLQNELVEALVPNACQIRSGACHKHRYNIAKLSVVSNRLRRRSVQFHFVIDLLNQRPLLFQLRSESIDLLLLFLHRPVLFEKLI